MKKAIAAACLILSLLAGMAVPILMAVETDARLQQMPDPEAEYYRAIYDVCVAQTRQPEMCLRELPHFREQNWYGQPSPGWAWPLPLAGDNETPRRGYPADQQFSSLRQAQDDSL